MRQRLEVAVKDCAAAKFEATRRILHARGLQGTCPGDGVTSVEPVFLCPVLTMATQSANCQ